MLNKQGKKSFENERMLVDAAEFQKQFVQINVFLVFLKIVLFIILKILNKLFTQRTIAVFVFCQLSQ